MSALSQARAPDSLRPWHEHVIDLWLANPNLTQREIAGMLGRSEYWLSVVVRSDAFQSRYSERKTEIVDPILSATVDDKLRGLVDVAASKLGERIACGAVETGDLVDTLKAASRALGMGANNAPSQQNNLYFLTPPEKVKSAQEWAERARQEAVMDIVDVAMPAASTAAP